MWLFWISTADLLASCQKMSSGLFEGLYASNDHNLLYTKNGILPSGPGRILQTVTESLILHKSSWERWLCCSVIRAGRSSELAKSSGEREGGCWQFRQVSTSRRRRCSKLKYGWHYIQLYTALCRSKEMLGGKILLTTAFKCWLFLSSSTSQGQWQTGVQDKV